MRHKQTNVTGVQHGSGCAKDAGDGRCNVLYAANCGVRHRKDGGERCKAQAVYCVRHGWTWRKGD